MIYDNSGVCTTFKVHEVHDAAAMQIPYSKWGASKRRRQFFNGARSLASTGTHNSSFTVLFKGVKSENNHSLREHVLVPRGRDVLVYCSQSLEPTTYSVNLSSGPGRGRSGNNCLLCAL